MSETNNPTFSSKKEPSETIVDLRNEVDQVTGLMKGNLDKIIERDHNLQDLTDKTEELSERSNLFHSNSRKLRDHMWWQNMKCRLMIGFIVFLVILLLIILPATLKHKK